MKSIFEKAYAPVKEWEGGYCNISGDSGGETYAGVARNFFPHWQGWAIIDEAKKHESFRKGSLAFSEHLSLFKHLESFVTEFYRVEWWDKMGLCVLPQALANEVFEQSINLGMGQAGKHLQRTCNALNYQRHKNPFFSDLIVDGQIGKKTLTAVSLLLVKRISETEFIKILNALQTNHYINLGAKNTHHRKFVNGWLTRSI